MCTNYELPEVLYHGTWYKPNSLTNVPSGTKFHFDDQTQIVVPPEEMDARTRYEKVENKLDINETTKTTTRTRIPRTLTNVRIPGDITNNMSNNKSSFQHQKQPGKRAALRVKMLILDNNNFQTKNKILVPVSVNGALTLPPESNVKKIKITPSTKAKSIPLPRDYYDAVTGYYREYWIDAIKTELNNLLCLNTWREEIKPPSKKIIPGRYVCRGCWR